MRQILLKRIKRWFTVPVFPADEEKTHRAAILHYSSILLLASALLLFGIGLIIDTQDALTVNLLMGALGLLQIFILWMLRSGYVDAASFLQLSIGWIVIGGISRDLGGIRDEAVFYYVLVVLASGYLLGWRVSLVYALASIAAIWWLAALETSGAIVPKLNTPYQTAAYLTVIFAFIFLVVHVVAKALTDALSNARRELAERLCAEAEREKLITQLSTEIAERKLVEEQLRKLSRAVEAAPVTVVITDKGGCIEYANPFFSITTGYDTSEVLGENPRILQSGLTPRDTHSQLWRTIQNGQTWEGEFINRKKNGELYTEQARISPIFDANNSITHFVAVKQDITKRKQAEEELQKSKEKFAKAFRLSADVITITSVTEGLIVEVNDSTEKVLGYTRDEAIGKSVSDLNIWPDSAQRQQYVANLRRDGVVHNWEVQMRAKSGKLVDILLSGEIIELQGDKYILGTLRDITERKQAEAQREAALKALRELNATLEQRVADRTQELAETSARLIELDQFKDQFIDRISHELRTPLAAILLYNDLLEHGHPSKHAEYRHIMHDKALELRQKINDLLDVSQFDLEHFEVRQTEIIVNALLHDLLTECTALALKREQTLRPALTADLPGVTGDPILLRQAVTNLLTNALNYTPARGLITLSTARRVKDAGEWVTIEVCDTGPGLSEKDMAHLFEPFYRGDVTRDYKIPGTGVGLFIARRAVEKLQGRLTVESTPGQGAVFTVWLRADEE